MITIGEILMTPPATNESVTGYSSSQQQDKAFEPSEFPDDAGTS
jgi:hypothetical protein